MHGEELNADIINDLLVLLTQFTLQRRNVLTRNLRRMNDPSFVPCDLAVEDFSDILNAAITEYVVNHRLLLRDTEAIHFGPQATVRLEPLPDHHGQQLRTQCKADYIQYQLDKLAENALNERLALKLLSIKQNRGLPVDDCVSFKKLA